MGDNANKNEELKGIGGWLELFMFTASLGIIFSTGFFIYEIYTLIMNPPATALEFILALFGNAVYSILMVCFAIYTIYSISKYKPNAVGLAKMLLIIYVLNNFTGLFISTQFPTAGQLIICTLWLIYFFKSKRIKNTFPINKRKTYPVDRIVFGILLLLTLLGLVGYFLEGRTIYQADATDISKTQLASEGICYPPNMQVGLRCCIPAEEMDGLCADEAEKFIQELTSVIEANSLSIKTRIRHEDPTFSLVTPKDYYLIRDIEMGGIAYPLYIIAFGEDDAGIEMVAAVTYPKIDEKNIEKLYQSILESSLMIMDKQGLDYKILNKGMLTNDEGLKGVLLELSSGSGINETHSKSVSFVNLNSTTPHIISLKFTAPREYEGYITDFDEMVDSFRFS